VAFKCQVIQVAYKSQGWAKWIVAVEKL